MGVETRGRRAVVETSLDERPGSADEDADARLGRQVSQNNLRQLKLSALEDVLVCDQRRGNTNAARRLFNQLAAGAANKQHSSGSLSSRSSCANGDNQSLDDEPNSSRASNQLDADDHMEELFGGPESSQSDDCGLIKLDRRCCSSSSSSSVNFGSTLVCSVSPTGQSNFGSATATTAGASHHDGPMNIHESATANQERDVDNLAGYYAINGDEIRHCRAAFRENRRLIEQVQSEACRRVRAELDGGARLRRSGSQAVVGQRQREAPDRSRWADSLGRRSRLPACARCKQKLYPVDKMELDFTRATLNIHRNCFKCQVCATLLRLETYASIDTKLYCPAHVKCAAPSR